MHGKYKNELSILTYFRYTPVGVASLIAASLAKVTDIAGVFQRVGIFVLAHTVGNAVYQLIILPVVYIVFIRKNPVKYLGTCLRPWMAAFAPPST